MSNYNSNALSGQMQLNAELLEGQRLADSTAVLQKSLADEAREDAERAEAEAERLKRSKSLDAREISQLKDEKAELANAVRRRNTVLRNMKAALRESVLREMAGFLVAVDVAKERSQSGTLGTVNSKDDVIVAKEEKRRELEASEKSLATIEKITEERVVEAVGDEEILEEINAADDNAIFTDRMNATRIKAEYAYNLLRKAIRALEKEGKVSPETMADLKKAKDANNEMEFLNTPRRQIEP